MKELVIKLRMDRSHAKAATDAQSADVKQLENQYKQVGAAQRQAAKEGSDATTHAEKAKQEAVAKTAKQHIDANGRMREANGRFVSDIKSGTEAHTAGLTGNLQAVGALVSGYGGLTVATRVVSAIGDMWRAQRKDIEDAVDQIAHYRDGMLELAALKDRLGKSTPELQSQLEFRAKTLQTRGSAQAFQQGALNVGQSAMASGLVKEEQFAKLMQLMGSYQAATNGDPKATGELTGAMPSLIGGQNQDAGDIFRRTVGIMKIFEKGGSDPGVAFSQFIGNSAYTKLGVFGPQDQNAAEKQAALQSQLSLSHTGDPGTKLDQLVRGTVGAFGRTRVGKLDGAESQRDYLMGLGAKPQMDPIAITRMIAADLKAKQAADPNFATLDYLVQKGYADEQARMAIMEASAGINTGQFDATFGKMAAGGAIPTLADAVAPQARFQAVDPVAQTRKADLAKDMADSTKATGPEGLYLNLKRVAFERLRARGKTSGTFDDSNGSKMWEGQIIDEMQSMLKEAGGKVGASDTTGSTLGGFGMTDNLSRMAGFGAGTGPLGGSPFSRGAYSNETRAKAFAEFATQIQEKGGKIDGMDQLVEMTRQALELQKKEEDRRAKGIGVMPNPAVPAPLRGAPPVATRQP